MRRRSISCVSCPRLVEYRTGNSQRFPAYFNAPVPPSGPQTARLLIVGLAPGMHGANRSGYPFRGDDSGRALFTALEDAGIADTVPYRITNAVRCVPPGNRPTGGELANCRAFLADDIATLWRPGVRSLRCIVALGGVAAASVDRVLERRRSSFRHGSIDRSLPQLAVVHSYHPSRLNMNTGRLKQEELTALFTRVAGLFS